MSLPQRQARPKSVVAHCNSSATYIRDLIWELRLSDRALEEQVASHHNTRFETTRPHEKNLCPYLLGSMRAWRLQLWRSAQFLVHMGV